MIILITGAAGGIGFDLAQKLSERGHVVYITTHTKSQLNEVKDKKFEEISEDKID